MANSKISALTAATTPLAGTEVLPIVQSSTTVKVAVDDLTVKNVRSNATTGILQIAGPGAGTTRTMTTPNANFTAARTDAAQTFTGTQTVLAAATQDAVALAGRAGGTGSYVATLTPTTLSASRTVTLPNADTTVPVATQVLTFSGPTAARTITLPDANFTAARTDAAQTFTGNQQFNNSVGIGGAPNVQFEVTSASGGVARVSGTGGTVPQLQLSSGGVVNWSLRANQASSSEFTIYQDSTERFRIASGGNITSLATYSATVGATNRDLFVDSTGLIGYVTSIRNSKTNIQPIGSLSWMYSLEPVSFNYRKKDSDGSYTSEFDGRIQFGLIAEDVEKTNPDLCFYDDVNGAQQLRGVNYSKLIAPMLKAIQDLKVEIDSLKAQLLDTAPSERII